MKATRLILAIGFGCVTLLLLAISGCGRGTRQLATISAPGDLQPAGQATGESFLLEMLEGSASAPLGLVCEASDEQMLVSVVAEEATELEGLFFNLHYDASRYTPLAAQATDEWASLAESIVLEVMDQPGVVVFGQVPVTGEAAGGIAPQSVLVEVLFAEEAFSGDTRSASQVPIHPAALAPLSWDAEAGELSWYYVNTGDYNQDGVVGIGDITPLAILFTQAGQFPFAGAESVVDGDDDGEITIGDLSVIAWYFGNCVEGYNLYYSEDFGEVPQSYAGPSVIDPEAAIPLGDAAGDPLVDRLRFVYLVGDPGALGFYWVRPVALDEEGIRSNVNGGNQSQQPPPGPGDPPDPRYNFVPIALLHLSYSFPAVPLTVTFDASESYDPDGVILLYDWDFDGDGLYDAWGSEPVIEHVYREPGWYGPVVRVTDNRGAGGVFQTPEFEVTEVEIPNIPPTADIAATVLTGEAPLVSAFLASGSTDIDGYIVNYEWDFDGDLDFEFDSGTDPSVLNTFDTSGIYSVSVRVTDDDGDTDTDSISIVVIAPYVNHPPVADLQATPLAGDVPLTVDFDATGSTDDSEIVRYWWDFDGDGTYDVMTVVGTTSHTYEDPGIFDVRVLVEDDYGATGTDTVSITVNVVGNQLPIADLQGTPTSGDLPLTVDFDASASSDPDGVIVRYDYDFDDDGIWDAYDSADTVSWTYGSAGSYDATLRVTDDVGAQDTSVLVITVNVPGNNPPVASVGAAPTSGAYPLTVDFDATGSSDSDGIIVRYDWDIDGDGNYELYDGGDSPTWTYNFAGSYDAYVKVTDDDGAQDTDFVTITVNVPPNNPPVANVTAAPLLGEPPLAVTFDATGSTDGDGTIVRYDWDFDGDGNYEIYDGGDSPTWTYTNLGTYVAAVKVTDDDGAQDIDTVTVVVTWYPTAVIDGSPSDGDAPLTVNFDGSGSSDPDGTIVKYEWDWESDGTYDQDTGGTPTTSHVYSAGVYTATLRVTDNDGATDTDSMGITAHGWAFVTAGGKSPDIVIINGNPAIGGFQSWSNVCYTRANDIYGASWGSPYTIAGGGMYGLSMAIINGNPAIAYETGNLYYVRANNSDGTSWGSPVFINGTVGQRNSLVEVNGRPAIAFTDGSAFSRNLAYVRALDANGSSWGAPITLDTAGDTGLYPSMAIVTGNPAIAWYDNDLNPPVKFIRANDPDGATWGPTRTVVGSGWVGWDTTLVVVQGRPAIACHYFTGHDVWYIRANDADGTSWPGPIAVDTAGDVGRYLDMAIVGGLPAIAYTKWTSGDWADLKFVWATSPDGSTWGVPEFVDTAGDIGRNPSIAEVAGSVSIAYAGEISENVIRYAHLY